ncbi:MAG: hypothetical protein AAF639_06665 [Chloroflexota bacterium]
MHFDITLTDDEIDELVEQHPDFLASIARSRQQIEKGQVYSLSELRDFFDARPESDELEEYPDVKSEPERLEESCS